jgi:hypothetical protein
LSFAIEISRGVLLRECVPSRLRQQDHAPANRFAFWAQAMQTTWFPWRAAAQAMLPRGLTLPQVEAPLHSPDGTGEKK